MQGDLFRRQTARARGREAEGRAAGRHTQQIDLLAKHCWGLRAQYPNGITVAELRHSAIKAGLLTGHERGRELSYLVAVPRRAGLVPTGQFVQSTVDKTHGRRVQLWRWPEPPSSTAACSPTSQ